MSPKPLTTTAFWEDRHHASSRAYDWPRPSRYFLDCELYRAFERHLPSLRGGTLLEVGCGSSVWLAYFSQRHKMRTFGVDLSPTGLMQARRNVLAHGEPVSLILGDAFQVLQEAEGHFDCIFSLGVIEHFEDPDEVIAALATWLKPRGLLVTWAPNIPGNIVRLSARLDERVASMYSSLSLNDLVASQQQAGLTVLEARYTQFADLTLVGLGWLPSWSQRWVSRLFRLASLPLVGLGHYCHAFLQSRRWCAGVLTVARRADHGSFRSLAPR